MRRSVNRQGILSVCMSATLKIFAASTFPAKEMQVPDFPFFRRYVFLIC